MQKRLKYIVLVPDGAADRPLKALEGKTPLEVAHTPHLDSLAQRGELGRVRTIPPGFPPGSDVANLSVFGYDPRLYYTGRGPLEAASIGVELDPEDVAFRCNLVTLQVLGTEVIMEDYSAGHIPTEESSGIIRDLDRELGRDGFRFFPGVSYRHLLVWKGGRDGVRTTPPHDIVEQPISSYLPQGEGASELLRLITSSQILLKDHPVNLRRAEEGKRPANSIWPWGQGRRPSMPPFREKYGLSGKVIAAVDLIKGIGVYAGMEVVEVPGATGWLDTDYRGKAEAGLKALEDADFLYLHVEAPDEASHMGDVEEKIRAIERFDQEVVGTILEGLTGDFRIMVLPDHPTPISVRTHVDEPVPFLLYDSRREVPSPFDGFSEKEASKGVFIEEGHLLMDRFIGG